MIIAIVSVAMIGIGIPSVVADQFDDVDMSQLNLVIQESAIYEASDEVGADANVLMIKLKAKNNSNVQITGYGTNPYLSSGSALYNPIYDQNNCTPLPTIPAGLSKNMTLCFVIPKDHSYPFSLTLYDNPKTYCGACEYCTCTSTSLMIEAPVSSISAGEDESQDNGGGCLIATATYGSEMATEVQQLRELRDNTLLQTESGTNFMGMFNEIYYSFSPVIADMQRENPVFKEMVKLAITPMISSLSILNYVDMNSESEVLGYGISLIILNLGMYLGVPAVVIVGIRKKF